MIFEFFSIKLLNNNKKLLLEEGYNQYYTKYLMNYNQYILYIFNKHNDIIGNAYKNDNSIKDYTKYLIKDELIALIKIYFNDIQLKNKFNIDFSVYKNYFLINSEVIEDFKKNYLYHEIEKELKKTLLYLKFYQV